MTRSDPAITPGMLKGNVTLKKIWNRLAPIISAARANSGGWESKLVRIGNTMKGMRKLLIPMITPVLLNKSLNEGSPTAFRNVLIIPEFPRMMVKAKLLTRILVQKGIKTRIINMARIRGGFFER
jgi:hypothetical protein